MEKLKESIESAIHFRDISAKNSVSTSLKNFLTTEYDVNNKEHVAVIFSAINTLALL